MCDDAGYPAGRLRICIFSIAPNVAFDPLSEAAKKRTNTIFICGIQKAYYLRVSYLSIT